mgnify:CR=1 FL=1
MTGVQTCALPIYPKFKNNKNIYQIPGGSWGTGIIGVMGVIGAIVTILIGFLPPSNINAGSVIHYALMILIGLLIMSAPILFLAKIRKDKR